MNNEDLVNDLKQFIAATVSQATTSLATKDELKNLATKDDIVRLEQKVDDLDLKIDTISETLNDRLNDSDTRLTNLEQQAA
jgi:hypothetical protein